MILIEDTGRSRSLTLRARGLLGLSYSYWPGQAYNYAGSGVTFHIGTWDITLSPSFTSEDYPGADGLLMIDVAADNTITGASLDEQILVGTIPGEDYTDREAGNWDVSYEAIVNISNLYEYVTLEMHNEGEVGYLSYGYPNHGYNEVVESDGVYSLVSSYKGGIMSGPEMSNGAYAERYHLAGEAATTIDLSVEVSATITHDHTGGGDTVTSSAAEILEASRGNIFTHYAYEINTGAAENYAQGYPGQPSAVPHTPPWFEADFITDYLTYPYALPAFSHEVTVPPGSDPTEPLIGTISSADNRITITPSIREEYPYQNDIRVAMSIDPTRRVQAKGLILNPDGSDWDGASPVELRALWQGTQLDNISHLPEYLNTDTLKATGGEFNTTYDLALFEVTAQFYWSWPYSKVDWVWNIDQTNLAVFYDLDYLDDAKQTRNAWRILGQDAWHTDSFAVVHPLSATVDNFDDADKWAATNATISSDGTALTVTATGAGALIHTAYDEGLDHEQLEYQWRAWRYCRVKVKSNTSLTLTMKVKYRVKLIPEPEEGDLYAHYIKEYDLTVAAGTAYVDYLIDLVAPNRFDGGQVGVDLTDWVADVTEEANQNPAQIQPIRKELKGYSALEPPLTEDDVMSFAPHELMGIGHIERLTFSGITNGAELKFDKLYVALEADKTNADKEALLTISPVFQESIVWAAAAEEGATEEEIAEAKKYHPEGKRILGGLANFKAAVDGAYAHRGGGYKGTTFPTISDMLSQVTNANTVAGLTISDGYQPTVGNPHHIRGNDHYLSLWLSPVLWDTTKGDIRIYDYKIKPEVPNQDTLIVQARPAMDIWNVYPGIGNPQGDYGGAYPYRFISVLGALMQGITYNKNSRRPAAGIPVEVYQQGPSAEVKVGTFTSNKHHFWRSSRLRTDRLYEPLSALARVDNSAIEDTWRSYMLCRRQHWASVIGPVPVTGGRPAVDHEKATGRTFVVNSTDAGLTLYKSENMGQTWPNPLVITDTEGYGPGAVAVSHGTCLRPIWVVAADSEGAFKCLTSGDDGGTWAMVTIVSGVTVAVAPSLKWNETRGILSATYAKEGSTYLVESPDMGQTWGTPVAILEAEAAGAITSINSNGLLAFVAIDDNGDLICKHSGDRGGSWT